MSKCSRVLTFVLLAGASGWAMAGEHVIQAMVTQWRPMVLFAQPGDTVRFMNMTGHDTATLEGMVPAGAEGWKSQLGEEGYSVKVEREGAYVYVCNPHISTGMVGVIVVGDERPPQNMAEIEANLDKVKVGKNMVNRALKKLGQALEAEGA